MDELRFDGQAVIVTGAGRGIGREYAMLLAERGASVVVNHLGSSMLGDGSTSSPANEVVSVITANGGSAIANYQSIATVEGSNAVVNSAIENYGRVDALINNAGIMRMVPFAEASAESLMKHFEVHMLGTMLMCKAVWPYMVEAEYGRIVNTVSGGIFGLAELTEYGPAKGAVLAFTRSLALEATVHGICVNAIAPQGATRMLGASQLEPELRERLAVLMRPSLVAPGAVFLAHQKCLLNGETLAVSGGRVCRIGLTENEGISDENLSPEMIVERLAEVLDESTARHWTSASEKYERRARN